MSGLTSALTPHGDRERLVWTSALIGAALLLAGLAFPWAGWYGIRSAGFLLGLLAVAAFATGRGSGLTRLHLLAAFVGFVAAVVLALGLATTPESPELRAIRSPAALGAGLVGSLLVTGAALLAARLTAAEGRRTWLDAERRHAITVAGWALAVSCLVVWSAGIFGVEHLGIEPTITRPPLAVPFGHLGDVLTAPATAWDGSYYLTIAQLGYAHGPHLLAFFPLYPALVRAAAWSPESAIVAGIALSLMSFGAALYLLHRLVVLDFDRAVADRAVWLVALSPLALFFPAVYSESFLLLLTIGAIYAARRGAWMAAGIAGALAAACRSTGILVLVPLLVIGLWEPGRVRLAELRGRVGRPARGLAWLLLVPAGLLAFLVYSAGHGDFLAPFDAQRTYWHRGFAPLGGAWRGVRDAVRSVGELFGVSALHPGTIQTSGQLADAQHLAVANLINFAALAFACVATVGVVRRLHAAYGAYAGVTLVATTSTYYTHQPLASVPRFLVVLFPCQVWLASRTGGIWRFRAVAIVSAGLLAILAARFASWRWVA
jgi:hypothetical protein